MARRSSRMATFSFLWANQPQRGDFGFGGLGLGALSSSLSSGSVSLSVSGSLSCRFASSHSCASRHHRCSDVRASGVRGGSSGVQGCCSRLVSRGGSYFGRSSWGASQQQPQLQQQRSFASSSSSSSSSNFPESTVYGGPIANPVDGGGGAAPRVTVRTVAAKYKKHEKLVMMTAYDYPSARLCDATPDIDMVLVGDSVAMVVHGHDTTLPITLDEMIVHSRAVVRGAKRPLIIGDLPFGSFETTPSDAVRAAVRMLKEGNVDAVKIEGSSDARLAAVSAISDAGIAVMGHVGLTPQSISAIGGFRPTGRTAEEAISVLDGAKRLQDAGCFAVVLECVPASVARAVTERLSIPTIGIGAGVHTSGQVLVFHDLLGIAQHPHHATVTPRFCKQYAQAGIVIAEGLAQYASEVKQAEFPSDKYSPYKMGDGAMDEFQKLLAERGE